METVLTTRVVLADDHQGIRGMLRKILERAADICVVGEACNGQEALELIERLEPQVLLLDMEMPVKTGIEVARQLYEEKSPVRVLAISSYLDRQYILCMQSSGAFGYITKDMVNESLPDAVRRVARGEKVWLY